jgi:hypothetical protein
VRKAAAVIFSQRGNNAALEEMTMQSLQMIQQLQPAAAISITLALPWFAATLMHAFGASAKVTGDEVWSLQAGAAVRWSDTIARLASSSSTKVFNFPVSKAAKRPAPAAVAMRDTFPHAA